MKGKIDKYGFLTIYRKNEYKTCDCPYSTANDETMHCGDWCPLFGEPILKSYYVPLSTGESEKTSIVLCHKFIEFDEFEDER